MNRLSLIVFLAVIGVNWCLGQQSSSGPPSSQSPPRSVEAEESSSHDTRIDISAPKDDAKDHPGSKDAVGDLEVPENIDNTGVQEFHPWNPLKAIKDIEVGDYYFKKKNYKAALARYKEALFYKD